MVLDGAAAGAGVNGLRVTSDGNVLRGLWIRNFTGDGLVIDGGANNAVGQPCSTGGLVIATSNGGWGARVRGESADNNAFGPDRFGTDGVAALGNGLGGLLIEAGADNNTFGNGCGAAASTSRSRSAVSRACSRATSSSARAISAR